MFNIALHSPQIPPNTGNIIRLCANTGTQLHLIEPLGFKLEDTQLRRAGLDYHEFATIQVHSDFEAFKAGILPARIFAFSTKGKRFYTEVEYQAGDVFLFGSETAGLPGTILSALPQDQILRLPMQPHSRSLNLSNTAAIALFEAWRQHQFVGGI